MELVRSFSNPQNAFPYNNWSGWNLDLQATSEQLSEHVQLEMLLPEAEVDLANGRLLGRILDVTGCSGC